VKVLLISGEYPPMRGGVADYTARLADALVCQGAEVTVLTSERAKIAGGMAALPATVESQPQGVRVLASVSDWGPGHWRDAEQVIGSLRPDVVNIQYQTGAYGMRVGVNILPWRLRLGRDRPRIVVTFHDLKEPYLLPKIGRLRHLATILLAAGADGVVVTNHEDYRRVASLANPSRARPVTGGRALAAIPIGSNIPQPPTNYDRARVREGLHARAGDTLIGFFGFLVPSKGLETLVSAFERLVGQGRAVRLAMIGASAGDSEMTGDSYGNEIRRRLEQPVLAEKVTWTGFAPDSEVAGYLTACDLVCLPFRDGASLRHGTLAAAIALARPIVTTLGARPSPASGLPQLVDGESAVLVPPGDEEYLATAITRVGDDHTLQCRLRDGARRLASAMHWQAIARQTLDFYIRIEAES